MCTRSLATVTRTQPTVASTVCVPGVTPIGLFVCAAAPSPTPSTAGQRSTIEKLVVLLGGSFCKTLGRQQRPTHLMLPRWGPDSAAAGGGADAAAVDGSADGTGSATQQQQLLPESTVKKIAYAMKHRVKMVVSEWLLDCAAEGRRVQEGLHRPEGDLSLLELPAGGCATQAGGGATQLPATQLPKTQQTQVSDCWAVARLPRCCSSYVCMHAVDMHCVCPACHHCTAPQTTTPCCWLPVTCCRPPTH